MNLLIALIIAGVLASGALGAGVAAFRKRSVALWFLLGCTLPLIGPMMVLLLPGTAVAAPAPKRRSMATDLRQSGEQAGLLQLEAPAHRPPASVITPTAINPMSGLPAVSLDERWNMLIEYDPLLREAADQLAPLGMESVDKLRQAYFVLQDRSLIPSIAARIREKHAARMNGTAALGRRSAWPEQSVSVAPAPVADRQTEARPALHLVETTRRSVPQHTSVTPQDLDSAMYVETYRGIHLYRLADGRTYIDGRLAVMSDEAARDLIEQTTAQQNQTGQMPARPDAHERTAAGTRH
jgi:hypothetical protein